MIKTRYPWQQIIKNENVYQIISFVVLCVMYIGVQLNWYLAAGRDDTYITLWSAFGVSQGHGFVNYNLQPAEISSSLLHVLILSLFALVQPDNLFVMADCQFKCDNVWVNESCADCQCKHLRGR